MCFVCFEHSVLSAININQNYSITLGLFPFQLLHYTFGMAWFSKCVVLGILREFDTFETILVSFSIFRRATSISSTRKRSVWNDSVGVYFFADCKERMNEWTNERTTTFWFFSLVIVSLSAFEQATVHYHFYSIHTLNTHSVRLRCSIDLQP